MNKQILDGYHNKLIVLIFLQALYALQLNCNQIANQKSLQRPDSVHKMINQMIWSISPHNER